MFILWCIFRKFVRNNQWIYSISHVKNPRWKDVTLYHKGVIHDHPQELKNRKYINVKMESFYSKITVLMLLLIALHQLPWNCNQIENFLSSKDVSNIGLIMVHWLNKSHMTPYFLLLKYIWNTVETPYSTIPYTTIFYITRWTHGPQNLQRPIRTLIVLLGFWINRKTRVICLFTARAVDWWTAEWTHMWPAAGVNNDGRTDYLRLSHLTTLPAGVNNHLRCIHKGSAAFPRVTPPIQMHDQTILTRSFYPMY